MNPHISSKKVPAPAVAEGAAEDRELVAAARNGDRSAFDALVARHQDRVFNMTMRMLGDHEDALDTAQEVFLSAYRGLETFDQRARFSTWLYRITVNRCRDQLRRRTFVKYTRPLSLDGAAADPEGEPSFEPQTRERSPVDHASARERAEVVERTLADLPDDSREILLLRDLQGLSYEEVAEILAIPVGTVRSRLSRARGLLRDRLLPMLEGEA